MGERVGVFGAAAAEEFIAFDSKTSPSTADHCLSADPVSYAGL